MAHTMAHTAQPRFRELDATEVNAVLTRNHVGRIAYSFHGRVDIEPIHYVFADGAFYLRTEPGSKLSTLAHAPWVAFEVDEVAGPFDWRSVVVHGTVYVMEDSGPAEARARYRNAVARLRELVPAALYDDDPAPARRVILKVFPADMTGRQASS